MLIAIGCLMTMDYNFSHQEGVMNSSFDIRGWVLFLFIIFLLIIPSAIYAWMWEMADEELAEVTGEGFSSFTLENEIARAYFNITASTFTEIESLKMGYYDDGASYGWDEDWVDVSLGSSSEDLVCQGLYIETGFSNIADSATRTLNYIKAGTPSMTGPISANFISFSGHIENPTDGVLVNGHRLSLGIRTITSTNSEFYMQLNQSGVEKGWWFYWNNATISP
jgi:hypothetical protein